jgi:hypothetical protein
MNLDQNNYGSLSDVVSAAGSIIAAALAIAQGWRKRARFEPSEEDIPKAPERVGGLVTAVIIGILWLQTRFALDVGFLTKLAIALLIACVAFLCIYGFLVGMQSYEIIFAPSRNTVGSRKIIGGFWLRRHGKNMKREEHITTQELLAGAAYDPDKVWSRISRNLAKTAFVICYLGLTVSGTVALACVAIIMAVPKH